MSCDKLPWIMVTVEACDPLIGTRSRPELGAAVGSIREGMLDRFEALIPLIGTAVVASPDSSQKAKKDVVPPDVAMNRCAAWSAPFLKGGAYFMARPAAFDWPWAVRYAWTFLGENPLGFKSVCASSWFRAKGKTFKVELPQVSARDDGIQLKHFLAEG